MFGGRVTIVLVPLLVAVLVSGCLSPEFNNTSKRRLASLLGGSGSASSSSTCTACLDPDFGTAGVAFTLVGASPSISRPQSMAVQSDGKIVVAGWANSGTKQIVLARYTSAGQLDSSFGTSGVVLTNVNGVEDAGHAIAIQADGKIVVAGYTTIVANRAWVIARYTTSGVLDATFGTGGLTTVDLGAGDDQAAGVTIQSDGKIIVAGNYQGANYDFAMVRLDTAGALDATFGAGFNGIVTTNIGTTNDFGRIPIVQSDGSILVVGESVTATDYDIAVARYTSAGILDLTFGGGTGAVTHDVGGNTERVYSAVLQADGKIVVAGASYNGVCYDAMIARFTSAGAFDATFGTAGTTVRPYGVDNTEILAMALQADGKIITSGYVTVGALMQFALMRFATDGSIDTSFASSGEKITTVGIAGLSYAVAIQSDGKILQAGLASYDGVDAGIAVLRYIP